MKIALVSQEYPPGKSGGISTQTHSKARTLSGLGHKVHVLSHSLDGQRRILQEGAVHVLRIPNLDGQIAIQSEPFRWLSYSLQVAIALTEMEEQSPFDLIEFPEYGAEGYAYLLNRPEESQTAVVIQLHGPLVMLAHTLGWPAVDSELYRVGTHMEGTCLRLADAVYSSSRCSAEWCDRHYGLEASSIPVMHTGIDVEAFPPRCESIVGRPTIVFVGKMVWNKGVDVLVEAACRLLPKWPDLCVKLIGRGEPAVIHRLRQLAADAGAPKLLEEVGVVERGELSSHLRAADVFAAPSRYEGGPGFVYLEAMASGLPVIACSGSGASEVISPDETGLLVPPDDVEAVALALDRLLSDRPLCEAMGRKAREFVIEHANTAQCMKKIEAFYQSAIDARRRRTV